MLSRRALFRMVPAAAMAPLVPAPAKATATLTVNVVGLEEAGRRYGEAVRYALRSADAGIFEMGEGTLHQGPSGEMTLGRAPFDVLRTAPGDQCRGAVAARVGCGAGDEELPAEVPPSVEGGDSAAGLDVEAWPADRSYSGAGLFSSSDCNSFDGLQAPSKAGPTAGVSSLKPGGGACDGAAADFPGGQIPEIERDGAAKAAKHHRNVAWSPDLHAETIA